MQKGANFSSVCISLLIGLNIKFYEYTSQSSIYIYSLFSKQLPYNKILSRSKQHRNPMWGTCKIVNFSWLFFATLIWLVEIFLREEIPLKMKYKYILFEIYVAKKGTSLIRTKKKN